MFILNRFGEGENRNLEKEIKELEREIERTREELYDVFKSESKSEKLLVLSQELDKLLNVYESAAKKQN